jgi:hypothetical protein
MCVSISPCVYFFSRIARLGEGGGVSYTHGRAVIPVRQPLFFFLPSGWSFFLPPREEEKIKPDAINRSKWIFSIFAYHSIS